MWKVHLPATSHLRKSVQFFGTNHFLRALNAPILKSAGLSFDGELAHGWAPTDQGLSDDPETHDHPPFNHHPKTGELIDGGLHPIDWVHRQLMRDFGLDPRASQSIIQESIDLYNKRHDDIHGQGQSNHTLPNFDSAQWRKVHAGPHYKNDINTHARLVRGAEPTHEGGPRPLLTYALNKNNTEETPGSAKGRWIDSGFIHFNRELGDILMGYQVDPKMVKGLRYVRNTALLPGDLSGGRVQSISPKDLDKYNQTGQLPDHYLTDDQRQSMSDQRMHPEVHPHQLAQLLPPEAFRLMRAGGRPRTDGVGGLTPERVTDLLTQVGLEDKYDDEQKKLLARAAIMRLLFQEKSHGINSKSGRGVGEEFRNIVANRLDSHHTDETHALHAQHAKGGPMTSDVPFARSAYLNAEALVAHMSNTAGKLMAQGLPQEEALNRVLTDFRGDEAEDPPHRELVQGVINDLMGVTGHERFSFGDIPTSEQDHGLRTPIPEFGYVEAPAHWQNRIYAGETALAPHGASRRDDMMGNAGVVPDGMGGGAGMGGEPAPAPPMAGSPPPMAGGTVRVMPTRMASPAEQAFQQRANLDPQQKFFDTTTGELVQQVPIQQSYDVLTGIDLIRKKMGYFDGFLRGEF